MPGTLGSWDPGTLALGLWPWDPGKTKMYLGTMEHLGTWKDLEPWHPGILGPWDPGTIGPWDPGTQGTWLWDSVPRTLEKTWSPGIWENLVGTMEPVKA